MLITQKFDFRLDRDFKIFVCFLLSLQSANRQNALQNSMSSAFSECYRHINEKEVDEWRDALLLDRCSLYSLSVSLSQFELITTMKSTKKTQPKQQQQLKTLFDNVSMHLWQYSSVQFKNAFIVCMFAYIFFHHFILSTFSFAILPVDCS